MKDIIAWVIIAYILTSTSLFILGGMVSSSENCKIETRGGMIFPSFSWGCSAVKWLKEEI